MYKKNIKERSAKRKHKRKQRKRGEGGKYRRKTEKEFIKKIKGESIDESHNKAN